MVPVCICGGSGYTGVELIRLLKGHPDVEIVAITSERQKGQAVTSVYPHLKGVFEKEFRSIQDPDLLKEAEVFFLALPHGESLRWVEHFYEKGKFVIDLSADCRLKDPEDYERWYGHTHQRPDLLRVAAYGIPEIYRERVQASRLVANPGCYPTGALLGLYPLVNDGLIETDRIVIDSKSGVSGAGRKADIGLSFSEVNESFRAYGVTTHRHTPEIEMVLSELAGQKVTVEFTPHLLPITRGILTTIYAKLKGPTEEKTLLEVYRRTYQNCPFVRVFEDTLPELKNVRGTNFCDIGLKVNPRTNGVIVVTAIDNLVKGASGQAVQNMNIMLNFPETTGLMHSAAVP